MGNLDFSSFSIILFQAPSPHGVMILNTSARFGPAFLDKDSAEARLCSCHFYSCSHDFRLHRIIRHKCCNIFLSKSFLKQPSTDRTGGSEQADHLNFRVIFSDGLGHGIKNRQNRQFDLLLDIG